MKRLIIIVVITVLVIGLGVGEVIYSTRLFGDLNAELTALDESIRANEGALDNAATLAEMSKVDEMWKKSRGFVLLSSNHAIARSLDEKLVSLRSWIECNGYEDARMLCAVSIALTDDLIDETYPLVTNLF